MNILVTGGTGYIGSHMVALLTEAGHQITALDNFSNSGRDALARLRQLCPKAFDFIEADVRDPLALRAAFEQITERHGNIDAVFHFAGLKAVGESNEQPLRYHQNNVSGTLNLCQAMTEAGVFSLIFSSSATVYGEPERIPLDEECRTGATNPYGRSKLVAEEMLKDLAAADQRWRIALLRYFNPVGAHPSGQIGELPNGIPNNIMPYICKVATGELPQVNIFGKDYPTPDGTGVRDYIHVCDLVRGHLAALHYLTEHPGAHVFNLGTGTGYSVLELIHRFGEHSGQVIPYAFTDRRPGDVATVFADPGRAEAELGWRSQHDLTDMIRDHWHWVWRHQQANAG